MKSQKNLIFPKIGMRNIKSAVSVFLCLLTFAVLHMHYSFYGCIAAVICTQPTFDKTYSLGKDRMLGTILGGIVGFIVLEGILSVPANENLSQLFMIPVGIIGVIYLCNLLKIPGAVSISCIVLLNIAINMDARGVGGSIFYVIDRVMETMVGIVMAMIVNRWFHIPKQFEKYVARFIRLENENVIPNIDEQST